MTEKKIGRRRWLTAAIPAAADVIAQAVNLHTSIDFDDESDASAPPLGPVRIIEEHCIAFKGPECGACVGHCPDGVSAIRIVQWRPVLNEDECVGCGLCVGSCPTVPSAIVTISPKDEP